MLAMFLALTLAEGVRAGEPEEHAPRDTATAKPLTWYQWTVTAGLPGPSGKRSTLRCAYRLPADLDPAAQLSPRNVVILLPDLGGDQLTLPGLLDAAAFRPRDILVSLPGFTPSPGQAATYLGSNSESAMMRDVVLEMSRSFPTARILLVGVGQGGLFAVHFAGDMARIIDGGVVAVGSGLWNWSRTDGQITQMPLAILHALGERTRPYHFAAAAHYGLQARGFQAVALRRLSGERSLDPAQLSACIDWCLAMRTDKPEDALAAARAILGVKPPAFAMARAVLARFEGTGQPFKDLNKDAPVARAAWDLSVAIEAHAHKHVDALRVVLKSPEELRLPASGDAAWIGHLLAVREDFRGVAIVESYLKDIGFDDALPGHASEAERLLKVVYSDLPLSKVLGQAIESLPKCFLFDGFPPDLLERLDAIRRDARALGIPDDQAARYDAMRSAIASHAVGQAAHEAMLQSWQLPPATTP